MAFIKIFCWALIFLLRLRFPPGQSIADVLKKHYNSYDTLHQIYIWIYLMHLMALQHMCCKQTDNNFKTSTHKHWRQSAIHKINCANCQATYIGNTGLTEHKPYTTLTETWQHAAETTNEGLCRKVDLLFTTVTSILQKTYSKLKANG